MSEIAQRRYKYGHRVNGLFLKGTFESMFYFFSLLLKAHGCIGVCRGEIEDQSCICVVHEEQAR